MNEKISMVGTSICALLFFVFMFFTESAYYKYAWIFFVSAVIVLLFTVFCTSRKKGDTFIETLKKCIPD